jgi:hypothetical protein
MAAKRSILATLTLTATIIALSGCYFGSRFEDDGVRGDENSLQRSPSGKRTERDANPSSQP